MASTELKEKVRQAILDKMDIEEDMREQLNFDTPLFGAEGIGLDSVDALELVTLIYDEWKIDVPAEDMKKLVSVDAIAEYVEGNNK